MSLASDTLNILEKHATNSHAGLLDFGTLVGKLIDAGVESYYADYRHGQTTYYFSSDHSHNVQLPTPTTTIAPQFNAIAVQQAVRSAQNGSIKYPEFMQLTMAAGCVGYIVWISGRHVQYFGRHGEVHIEHFPQAN